MIESDQAAGEPIDRRVRIHIFAQAAATGHVPQAAQVAEDLAIPPAEVTAAIKRLAAAKVLILAPNDGEIWAANPFCAVPSGFRVEIKQTHYWGICIWDALGIVAALHAPTATVRAPCGDCGDLIHLEFSEGTLVHAEGVIHFAVPARQWWQNIGFA